MRKNIFITLSLLLVCLWLTGCKDKTPYGNNPKAGKYYNIRGIKMYAETYGKGRPLLMLHGNRGSIATFTYNIPFFAKKYKVIIPDGRSQGKTIDGRDSISFEMMADDYAELLDSMHIDSAYVIGWSDGGINAMLLAMRHPKKVAKLASSGANLWPDSTAIDPRIWKTDQIIHTGYLHTPVKDAADKNVRKFFNLDWGQPHIILSDLHKINCPSFIICGDHDMVRTQHSKLIAKNIAKSNFWMIDHSGHGTLFEHKRSFNNNIDAFFKKAYHPDREYTTMTNIF